MYTRNKLHFIAMKYSWTFVILLVLAFLAVQYTNIKTFKSLPSHLCPVLRPQNCSVDPKSTDSLHRRGGKECPHLINNSSCKTHILVLATMRTGSSFVGELLNYHSDIFYLYEPLTHVCNALSGVNKKIQLGASRDLLRSLYSCELYTLESYLKPLPVNHTTRHLWRPEMSKALQSPPVCEAKKCVEINLTLAAESCQQRHVALKLISVPEIGDLQALIEDPRLNLKVIQLVRDPRGIMSSCMDTFPKFVPLWRTWRATGKQPKGSELQHLTLVCNNFLRSVSTGLSNPPWLRGKYMLLRYEDMAHNPLQKTKELYDFLGFPMDKNVVDWIQANTKGGKGSGKPYSTVRDSANVTQRWRLKLPFDMVEYMQDKCKDTLNILGYKSAKSAEELQNMTVSLVQDKHFVPSL